MKPIQIIYELKKKGFEAYFVGGFVRDMLMGINPKDIDIVTSANPDEIINIFKNQNVKEVGKNFGVIMVDDIEVATFRSDKYFGGSDKNCKIKFVKSLEEDVIRRDLTINGLAYDPLSDKIYDFVGGQEDIKDKIIRFIGDPYHRILEDPNRIIRACRFKAKINGSFESNTKESLIKYSDYIETMIAPERIRLEILKAMEIKYSSLFWDALHSIGGLKYILPSLENTYNKNGGPYHIENIWDHSLMSGDHISTKFPLIKLAGYLHDIGKPISEDINPRTEDIWFLGHDKSGAKAAMEELSNLKFSNKECKYISTLIRLHMRVSFDSKLSPRGVRKTLRILAEDEIPFQDLIRVGNGDKMGGLMAQKIFSIKDIRNITRSFSRVINEKPVTIYSDLKLNGDMIMEITGLKPGKEIGSILKFLMDKTLEDPGLNTEEELTKLVMEWKNDNSKEL